MSSIKITLMELIVKNFIELNKNKTGKNKKKKNICNPARNSSSSISAVLISSEIKKIKNESKGTKAKENLEETAEEEMENKKEITANGGYGTISKHYGISPVVKYIDYNKIWNHLGTFKTYNMYENAENSNEIAMKNGESTREMVSKETIEKAARHFKYCVNGEQLSVVAGYVPPFGLGIDSKEWEKYRLMTMMSIYRPLLTLKWVSA